MLVEAFAVEEPEIPKVEDVEEPEPETLETPETPEEEEEAGSANKKHQWSNIRIRFALSIMKTTRTANRDSFRRFPPPREGSQRNIEGKYDPTAHSLSYNPS